MQEAPSTILRKPSFRQLPKLRANSTKTGTPTFFSKSLAGYESWGNAYEIATIVITLVLIVLYGVANYFWQEKMKHFRAKSDRKKLKKKK